MNSPEPHLRPLRSLLRRKLMRIIPIWRRGTDRSIARRRQRPGIRRQHSRGRRTPSTSIELPLVERARRRMLVLARLRASLLFQRLA